MSGHVILLVDDDPDLLGSLEQIVRIIAPTATIHALSDGARALAAMQRLRPDVVVTDLGMPNLGGRDYVSMLNQWGNRARVIVLSGADEKDLVEAGELPNVVAVLRKPPDMDEFRAALVSALRG